MVWSFVTISVSRPGTLEAISPTPQGTLESHRRDGLNPVSTFVYVSQKDFFSVRCKLPTARYTGFSLLQWYILTVSHLALNLQLFPLICRAVFGVYSSINMSKVVYN